jgi:predicted RNA binding protein YcfA (HicA-like mRNA interferase family)
VPPKIRELIALLESAGFENQGGKGSHRNYKHPNVATSVTISGKLGDDAHVYQEKLVKKKLEELK